MRLVITSQDPGELCYRILKNFYLFFAASLRVPQDVAENS